MNNNFATDQEIAGVTKILLGENTFDEERINVIRCNSSCNVVACPGSGKTTVLLAKLIILANRMPLPNNKGICVITHTNVAIDEIKSKLGAKADVLFQYPNFFGTIQNFVDNYLTAKYARYKWHTNLSIVDDELALRKFRNLFFKKDGAEVHKSIRNRAFCRNGKKPLPEDYLNNFANTCHLYYRGKDSYTTNNALNAFNSPDVVQCECKIGKYLYDQKLKLFEEGIYTYKEALNLGLRCIEEIPQVAEMMKNRFKYLFVDEMQDSDSTQREIIAKLFEEGDTICQYFGDPCQSIYEDSNDEAHWNPGNADNILTLTKSMRFGDDIGNILKTMCIQDNSNLQCNQEINSHKPILLVYEDPSEVLPKFAHILSELTITVKGQQVSIVKYAKDKGIKDPFKAVGYVGRSNQSITIPSYFPEFDISTTGSKPKLIFDSIYDLLPLAPQSTIQSVKKSISSAIVYMLNEYRPNQDDPHITIRSFEASLDEPSRKRHYELMARFSIGLLSGDSGMIVSIIDYLRNNLLPIWDINPDCEDVKKFFTHRQEPESTDQHEDKISDRKNIYTAHGFDIHVSTAHKVKGETHLATLFMETSYRRNFESKRFAKQLIGEAFPANSSKDDKRVIKIAYVALSRAKYLTGMAISKSNFEQLNKESLLEFWDVRKCENANANDPGNPITIQRQLDL